MPACSRTSVFGTLPFQFSFESFLRQIDVEATVICDVALLHGPCFTGVQKGG